MVIMDFLLQTESVLRDCMAHRATLMSYPAIAQATQALKSAFPSLGLK